MICCYFSDISVICDDVTGSVGKEVNLTCSVSLLITDCCIIMYRFQYPEIYNDSAICKKELPPDSCAQRNSFTCSYTPTTAITQPFRFFLQTTCGRNTTKFTLNIPGLCIILQENRKLLFSIFITSNLLPINYISVSGILINNQLLENHQYLV